MNLITSLMDEMRNTLEAAFVGSDVAIQVASRMITNPTPPTVDMYPGDPFNDHEAAPFGSLDGLLRFTVRARVHTADNEAGQALLLALMDFLDDLSVSQALFDDQSLNGWASSVNVEGPSGYTEFVEPGGSHVGVQRSLLGCSWRVSILAAHS